MSKVVGYFEGSDSVWLTSLLLLGHDTLPLSNGADGHGLNIQALTPQHNCSLVIGYLHKLVPVNREVTPADLLHATKVYEIPVLIACPSCSHEMARNRLGDLPANVKVVDPNELLKRAEEILAR